MSINEIIAAAARKHIGVYEWAGADANPEVLAMYAAVGHGEIKSDEVPWCAAFTGSVLAECGLQHTGSLLAKSYMKWGEPVADLSLARVGDIIVLHRGTEEWQGHVGFFMGVKGNKIEVLGGNQNDQVNISPYSRDKLAGIRRAKLPRTSIAQSTTVGATGVGATAILTSGATAITGLQGEAQVVAVIGLLVGLAAFAWIFRERIKKFAEGVR